MSHKIIISFVVLVAFIFLAANSSPMIELKPGMNEETIKVLNKCDSDFESIHVVVDPEDLAEGLTICQDPQSQVIHEKNSFIIQSPNCNRQNMWMYSNTSSTRK